MSIRIEVASTETTPTRYTPKGKSEPLREQVGWAFLTSRAGVPDKHPTRIVFIVDEPYAVGHYTLSPSAFYVGDYSKLSLSVRLVPIKAA